MCLENDDSFDSSKEGQRGSSGAKREEGQGWLSLSGAWRGPPDLRRSGPGDLSASNAATHRHDAEEKASVATDTGEVGRKGETSGLNRPCSELLKLFLTRRHFSRVYGWLVRGWGVNCLLTPVQFKLNLLRLNISHPLFFPSRQTT